jgi:hypothetical protein
VRGASGLEPAASLSKAGFQASVRLVLRSSRELARVTLEGNWIDFPRERIVRVRSNHAALSIELDDFGAHRPAFVFGAVTVGVEEKRLDPVRLLVFTIWS